MEEDWGIRDPEHVLRLKTFAMALPVEFGTEIGGAVGFLQRNCIHILIGHQNLINFFPGKNGLNIGIELKL